jgi:hypothetical protein
MPAETYHADPVPWGSLSSSGARKLLPPSCPALYRWEQDHGQATKRVFELGTAAHKEVLGNGPELVVIDGDWRTKAAKQARDDARAAGAVPLHTHEYEQVQAMAAALRAHPDAARLFDASRGKPEQSLFWVDEDDKTTWRRARYDWYPVRTGNRLIIPEYKTTTCADPGTLRRTVYSYGYHMQAAFYLDGAKALGLAGDTEPAFIFVFQEKTPPYLVTVAELDPLALEIGRARNRDAIARYAECTRTGRWPGYSSDVVTLSLPPWAENAHLNGMSNT